MSESYVPLRDHMEQLHREQLERQREMHKDITRMLSKLTDRITTLSQKVEAQNSRIAKLEEKMQDMEDSPPIIWAFKYRTQTAVKWTIAIVLLITFIEAIDIWTHIIEFLKQAFEIM